MAILINFQNVSLYPDESYGLANLSFTIERSRKYFIQLETAEKLNALAGLLENRFGNYSGFVERKDRLFVQSDRLLMGDRVYRREAKAYLAVDDQFFTFGGRKRSKFGFIETLNARRILDFPIYRLTPSDRIKFTLLALAFQESGLILISGLLTEDLDPVQQEFLKRVINQTQATCCLLGVNRDWINRHHSEPGDIIHLELSV